MVVQSLGVGDENARPLLLLLAPDRLPAQQLLHETLRPLCRRRVADGECLSPERRETDPLDPPGPAHHQRDHLEIADLLLVHRPRRSRSCLKDLRVREHNQLTLPAPIVPQARPCSIGDPQDSCGSH